jgi:hypothetical protein
VLRQLIALCPPHRIEIQAEVFGNLLQRCSAVKLTGARPGTPGQAARQAIGGKPAVKSAAKIKLTAADISSRRPNAGRWIEAQLLVGNHGLALKCRA